MKNNTIIYAARASNSKRLRRMICIVACCHGLKLCAHAARDFRLQQPQHSTNQASGRKQQGQGSVGAPNKNRQIEAHRPKPVVINKQTDKGMILEVVVLNDTHIC